MRICVGDIQLFVDVVGSAIAIEGHETREKPAMVLLHGGPGFDHMSLRPDFESLSDICQLFFVDQRGNGRSDRSDAKHWNLRQWSRDLKTVIDTLGLVRPIIFGQSFGGIVAQQFAADHPGCYSGVILASTSARFNLDAIVEQFESLYGPEPAFLARQYFSDRTPDVRAAFQEVCFPLYTVSAAPLGFHSIRFADVAAHFFANGGEGLTYDLRERLREIDAPVLILSGDKDPVLPRSAIAEMAANFRPGLAEEVRLENCGHGPARDKPGQTLYLIRSFLRRLASRSVETSWAPGKFGEPKHDRS